MHQYTAVWIDQERARIFNIDPEHLDEATLSTPLLEVRYVPQTVHEARREGNERYFRDVSASLVGTQSVLILGPSMTKFEFLRHAQRHDHDLELRIVGVETVEHPTDKQIIAHARKHFKLT